MYDKKQILYFMLIFVGIYAIYKLFVNKRTNNVNYKSKYIASRSYYSACDHQILFAISESTDVPQTYPVRDGETIYINTTAIPNFVTYYLPHIENKFVLVSGDTDATIPDDYKSEVNTILNNKYLLKWYAQNSKKVTDKLIQLPIGLDIHTLLISSKWGKLQSIEEQEESIDRIKNMNIIKQNKCYSNFHFGMSGRYTYDRQDAVNQISKDLIFYEPKPVSRIESWENMVKYKYVVSPLGNGLDCHRTWEAIILGCIPIVKKSELDTMYDGLPVLIVNNWSDITQNLLDNFKPEYRNIEKIYMKYWINKFNEFKLN